MATRGWGTSIALAVGVAAGTSAAQLGFGYGLGIMAWTSATDTAGESAWLASLAWTTWIAATSTVLGAVVADRLSAGSPGAAPPSRRPGSTPPGQLATTAWRLVLSLTAGIGGLLTVPLVAVPARAAHRPDTISPQLVAGGYAVVGVAVGLAVAIAALTARAVAANVIASGGWLWALALASAVRGVAGGQGFTTAQLAVWRFGAGNFIRQTFSLPGAGLMMGAALVIGVLAAWPALRRADNPVGVAVSGTAGPVLVAAAYFLAAPKLIAQPDEQLSAYLIAPYTVLAGLAGSVLMTAVATQRGQRLAAIPTPREEAPVPEPEPASVGAAGTPDWSDAPATTSGPRRSSRPKRSAGGSMAEAPADVAVAVSEAEHGADEAGSEKTGAEEARPRRGRLRRR